MSKPDTDEQASPLCALTSELAAPQLALSSHQADWDGLAAQALLEPSEMESWRIAATPTITLMLLTGGAMHVELRQAHASWEGGDIQPGELILNWGTASAYEVRW